MGVFMPNLQAALTYAHDHKDDFLNDFLSFLKIPSISTLPENKKDVEAAAQWVASQLEKLSFNDVAIMPTSKHPVVYGSWMRAGSQAPTILVYGHYDVQPVDPIDLWQTDPFDPHIRDDSVFSRGASDMKGQIVAHLKAMESILQHGDLPVNIKYMIEGEEEIGSPSLIAFLEENGDLFKCDFCLNADSGMLDADTPSLTYALRGLAYFEIRLQGPSTDLHSGTFGGAVINPGNVLCNLIAGMKDQDYKVTLPGFYDHVRPLSKDERQDLAKLPQSEDWWMHQSGADPLDGETGYTSTERATARPTLDVNGLYSGFIGEGSKTVLPAKAMAKISMRLVPDQSPELVKQSLKTYLAEKVPAGITWELEDLSGCMPGIIDRNSDAVNAASRALESVWGKSPLFKREGGSVPVVGLIKEMLGVNSLMLGFGLPDDNLHAPNEKMYLPNFYRGIETFIRFMFEIAGE
jgi:acetylornithine deacetylase/succinyl-diaminopimelate desuccinylase-like protein